MSRRIENLSAKEVLALAIHVERANTRRFRAFADVFAQYDEAAAARFEELAQEEAHHESLLKERYGSRFDGPIPIIDEMEVEGVVESVDMEDPECLIFASLEPDRVYELALKAEVGAQEFYRKAADATSDDELALLYRELEGMEDEHRTWLEERIRSLHEQEQRS